MSNIYEAKQKVLMAALQWEMARIYHEMNSGSASALMDEEYRSDMFHQTIIEAATATDED